LCLANAFGAAPMIAAPGANTIAPTPSRRKNERRGRAFGGRTGLVDVRFETDVSWPFEVGPFTFDFVCMVVVFMPQESRTRDR